jgi:predicted nucleotidyltransferase
MKAETETSAGMNPTRRRAVENLRKIVLGAIGERNAAVYLFGSHARGEVRHASDIDVAVLPREELPIGFLTELAEQIEESTIPYNVDLVDLREVSPAFRDAVLRTGIKWRD